MKKQAFAAVAVSLLSMAAPASAVTQIIYAPSGTLPAYIKNPGFSENFTPDTPVANGTLLGSTTGISGSATSLPGQVRVYTAPVSGFAATPTFSSGEYLGIGGTAGNSAAYTLAFGGAGMQVVSFVFGSLDSFNSVVLNFAGGTSQTLTGLGIIGSPVGVSTGAEGRVTYDRGGSPGITSIVFSSAGRSFEIDSIVAAAPEPGTWGMMIVGFGLAGAALRVRRRDGKLARA